MKKMFFCIFALLYFFDYCLASDNNPSMTFAGNESICDVVGKNEENRIVFDFTFHQDQQKVFFIIPKSFLIKDKEKLKGILVSSNKQEDPVFSKGILCGDFYVFIIPEKIGNVVLVDIQVLTNEGEKYLLKIK